ncbi:MAG: glycogen/starch synthase [Acidimicrobiia bacterium]
MRVLFATAELAPLVKVGGLADFSAGLTRTLRSRGLEVDIVLPDYGFAPFQLEDETALDVSEWATPAVLRRGLLWGVPVSLVSVPGMARPNPYLDADGVAWEDNDQRFFGFSIAVAAWTAASDPDVLHLNDWHTAAVLGFMSEPPPSLLAIHNLAYQGNSAISWLDRFHRQAEVFGVRGETNPLAGGIALADQVVTVSPTFATESLPPNEGFGLARHLEAKGAAFSGILNGIDTEVWDPAVDPHLPHHYEVGSIEGKVQVRDRLIEEMGWDEMRGPVIGMVTRLTDQKGVDLALGVVPDLAQLGARMMMLGSGDRKLADDAKAAETRFPGVFKFVEGYDDRLAHRIFGGADLYLMPSRFEPAGLTQMQAMRYGTIPVVSDVGGLHDSVVDADIDPVRGTGFVAARIDVDNLRETLFRAVRAWNQPARRVAIMERGMSIDWSWDAPASEYVALYERLMSVR